MSSDGINKDKCLPPSLHPSIPPSLHSSVPPSLRVSVPLSLRPSVPPSLHPSVPPSLRPLAINPITQERAEGIYSNSGASVHLDSDFEYSVRGSASPEEQSVERGSFSIQLESVSPPHDSIKVLIPGTLQTMEIRMW